MEYTRYSSQPATVDLVRADLAETWTIDGFEAESPKRSPSISRVSDMLDLEYISIPSSPTSKAPKRDPLPEILGDFLELSPVRGRRRSESQERRNTYELLAKANGKTSAEPLTRSPDKPVRANRQPNPVAEIGATKSTNSPRDTQPQHSKTNKRKNPTQSTTAAKSPVKTSGSKSRKAATSSTAKKGPAKSSKQANVNSRSLPARARAKKRADDDLFELSDVTDPESESRPKKRQAKQPSPKGRQSLPRRKARIAEKQGSSPVIQNNQPTPVPKKPTRHDALQNGKTKTGQAKTDNSPHGEQVEVPNTPDYPGDEIKPMMTRSAPSERPREDNPGFTFQGRDSLRKIPSPEPQKYLPSVGESASLPRAPMKHQDVITLSSESADLPAAESNSPMLIEQAQESAIAEDGSDTAIMINTGPNSDQHSPKQPSVDHGHLSSTPPASFQLHPSGQNHQSIENSLPARIQEAFFSDGQLAAPSSPPAPALQPNAEECSRPQDVWKQMVEDDSPPAILRRIVTVSAVLLFLDDIKQLIMPQLLHRSLKPREEVIRDIADDYRANALTLLNNLTTRHDQEKTETSTALRKASSATFTIFSGAGQDMAILINKLRDMDVTHTADIIKRPVLTEKLDSVVRLCQSRLSSCIQEGPIEDDVVNEPGDSPNVLAETYRLKLIEAARQSASQSPETSGKVDLRVDEFMRQCLDGKPKRIPSLTIKEPHKPARNADEALEVLLDGIIDRFQESRDGGNLERAVSEDIGNVVSEDFDVVDVADMDFLA